jgi:hypothetical protein
MSRSFICLCAATTLFACPAAAQVNRVPSAAVFQEGPILEGTWTTRGVDGPLVLSEGATGVLTGTLAGQTCTGQARGADFTLACLHTPRTIVILFGRARSVPPVATQRSARVVARPAAMNGEFYFADVGRPVVESRRASFSANRN